MEEMIKDEGLGEVINTVKDLIAKINVKIKQAVENKTFEGLNRPDCRTDF